MPYAKNNGGGQSKTYNASAPTALLSHCPSYPAERAPRENEITHCCVKVPVGKIQVRYVALLKDGAVGNALQPRVGFTLVLGIISHGTPLIHPDAIGLRILLCGLDGQRAAATVNVQQATLIQGQHQADSDYLVYRWPR